MKPDRRITKAIGKLEIAGTIKPHIDHHLAQQLAHTDTNTPNETGITGGGLNDPVITAVLRRANITDHTRRIDQALNNVEAAINELGAALNRVQIPRPRATDTEPTCTGGDPSSWGDPTCGELVASYKRSDGSTGLRTDGLCDKHRMRKHRHEQEHVA